MSYMDDQEDQSPMARAARWKEFQVSALDEWSSTVTNWKCYTDGRCIRCSECHQSIYFTHDLSRREYQYTEEEIRALLLGHIRQVHDDN